MLLLSGMVVGKFSWALSVLRIKREKVAVTF